MSGKLIVNLLKQHVKLAFVVLLVALLLDSPLELKIDLKGQTFILRVN